MNKDNFNQLTISNVVKSLEKHKFSLPYLTEHKKDGVHFCMSDYNRVIKDLLDEYFNGYNEIEMSKDYNISSDNCNFNPKFKSIWFDDVIKLEFDVLYPNIICNLFDEKHITFNIQEFGYLYRFLVNNIKTIKEFRVSEEIRILWKILINYTYGALINNKFIIKIDRIDLIRNHYQKILLSLFKDFPDDMIYYDTDQIYFRNTERKDEILNRIDEVKVSYKMTEIEFYFEYKRQYLEASKDCVILKNRLKRYK